MSGLLKLIDELLSVLDSELPCVVCTVAATRGSTPQKAGAMMLVFADGTQSGTLGGGCVEAEVKKQALAALTADTPVPKIHTFHLDEDYGWDDSLICGGRMTIVAEMASRAHFIYFASLKQLLDFGAAYTEVIALPENSSKAIPGTRGLFTVNGSFVASTGDIKLPPLPEKRARAMVVQEHAVLITPARIRLLIVGAGHVGEAVANYAHDLNFDVWILDDREKFANDSRFPHASRRIVGDIGRELQALQPEITSSTYCLIVTRGHSHDEEALYQVVKSKAGYIGMIGSKRKVRLIFDDLRAKGISDEALARVRAPIGLDIGSQTVPEIAVSILAELIAYRNLGASPSVATGGLSFKE